jgi:SAM-dependent methyltransferase
MTGAVSTAPDLQEVLSAERPIRWPLTAALVNSPMVAYRNRLAEQLAQCEVDEILRAYAYMSVDEMEQLLGLAEKHALSGPIRGVGLELGAGTGLLSAVVARRAAVEAVLALEICGRMADLVIPMVARSVLGDEAGKILPVVGSFDDLHLPDESLDFVVDFDSLHHSDDLPLTLAESARVLKRGGTMLIFDRCHPDALSDEHVRRMLGRVYSRDFLIRNHYPPDVVLTRRENGEHEYRLFEWQDAFAGAGLRVDRMVEFQKPLRVRHAVKGLLSPFRRRRIDGRVTRNGYRVSTARDYLRERLAGWLRRDFRGDYVLAPKRTTVFVLSRDCPRRDRRPLGREV